MSAIASRFDLAAIPQQIRSAFSQVASKDTFEKISRIAHNVFLHLSVSLAINIAFDAAFGVLVLPLSAHVLTICCAAALAVVIALKVGKWAYDHFHVQPQKAATPAKHLPTEVVEDVSKGLSHFSIVHTLTLKLSTYIHEAGHALAAMACFVNSSPKIVVKWASGLTEYTISYGLTRFGSWLGEHASRIFVTAAGLIVPSLFALGEFAVAYSLRDKLPALSEGLNYHGLSQLMNTALYGISTFTTSKMVLAHDFVYLWHIGEIHPAIALALLVGVPLCAFLAFQCLTLIKKRQHKNSEHSAIAS